LLLEGAAATKRVPGTPAVVHVTLLFPAWLLQLVAGSIKQAMNEYAHAATADAQGSNPGMCPTLKPK
jgi:hypothetical protein